MLSFSNRSGENRDTRNLVREPGGNAVCGDWRGNDEWSPTILYRLEQETGRTEAKERRTTGHQWYDCDGNGSKWRGYEKHVKPPRSGAEGETPTIVHRFFLVMKCFVTFAHLLVKLYHCCQMVWFFLSRRILSWCISTNVLSLEILEYEIKELIRV